MELNYNNKEQWLEQIEKIPAGTSDEEWKIAEVTVESEFTDVTATVERIKYRNVMGGIRFFLGHVPFAGNLAYAPVRLYNKKITRNVVFILKCTLTINNKIYKYSYPRKLQLSRYY